MRARSTCSIPLKVLHTDFWSTSECQRPGAHKQRHVVMKVACVWPARSITVSTSCNNVARCCVDMLRAFGQALRSYDGNCKENVTLKLNFALSWVSCDYSMLITLNKIGGVHFCVLGTNGFHVKVKNERFTPASLRCRQNLKYENFTSSFARLRQNIAPKSVPHVQHDYFFSFN